MYLAVTRLLICAFANEYLGLYFLYVHVGSCMRAICAYSFINVYMYMFVLVHVHVLVCVRASVCVYVCVCLYVFECVCVCVCVRV